MHHFAFINIEIVGVFINILLKGIVSSTDLMQGIDPEISIQDSKY